MSILIELEQFGKPRVGRERFVAALQAARAAASSSHPLLDWSGYDSLATPSLVFDLGAIERRMSRLASCARANSVIPLFAVKSCTEPEVLRLAARIIGGFDVSNMAEYALLPEDLQGGVVSLTSPMVIERTDGFTARGNRTLVVLDSPVQVEHHLAQAEPHPYLLRVQGSALLQNAVIQDPAFYPATRFGMSPDEVGQLLRQPAVQGRPPAGFHVHHGSEMNRLSTFKNIADGLAGLARASGFDSPCINLGGGWHLLSDDEIDEALRYARKLFPVPCEILFEPGRWYTEQTGFAAGTIRNISRSGEIVRCTLDLSGKSHLHWSSCSLMHEFDARHENGNIVQFFGPSCYESDFIGKYFMPCTDDVLVDAGLGYGRRVWFSHVSSYSVEWNTAFNGIPEVDVQWVCL